MDPALPIVINCAVCNELFHADPPAAEGESDRRPRLLPCAHIYCTECAEELVQSSPACRVCQKPHGASTLDGIPLHTALIDWTKRLVQQMKDAMQAQQGHEEAAGGSGGGGSSNLSDSGVLYNSVNSAAGMPSLDPPSSFPALPTLNFSMDAGADEDEDMDGPHLGQPPSSSAAAAGGSAAAAAASAANAGQFYAFAGAPGSAGVTPGAALSNPLVRPIRGAGVRRMAQSMNPQRKILELSALQEIGFEQQAITDDDMASLGTPQFVNNIPLIRQWLTKLHLEHPEKRRKQTVKNEYTGSALVQSLNAIFACACNRVKFGQKQKAMQHIVNKHSEAAIAAAMANERTAVPGRHIGTGAAAAGGNSLASPSHHHGHVAMTAAETAAWQKSLLQQAGSSDAAEMPALSSLAAPHAAAVPVPLLAPSATDTVPKAEPGSDNAQPIETGEGAETAPADRPAPPLATVILADDTIWLQRGFAAATPTSADWNRLTQSWRIALVSEHLTKMVCVDEEKRRSWDANLQLAAVMGSEPAQLALAASQATKDLTTVFSCKCRGVAWGKRSEAFAHIASAHSHTADARKQTQQKHYTTVPYVPPAGTAAAALAAAAAGTPTAATATPAAVCAQCGNTGEELLQCSACLQTVYCSPLCQRTHWKAHKTDCKKIQAAKAAGLPVPAASSSSPAGAAAAGAPSPNPSGRARDNGYRSRYELLAQVADLTESQRVLQTSMVRLAAEMTQWRDAAQALRKEREIAQNSDYVDVTNGQTGFAGAASSSAAPAAAAPSSDAPVVKSEHAAAPASSDEVSMLRAQNSRLREELSFLRTSHVASLEKRLREWETAFGSMLPAEAHRMQQEQSQSQSDELRRSLTAEFQAKLRNLTEGLFNASSFGSPSSAVSATAAAIAAASAAAAAPHTPAAATRTRPASSADAGDSHESAAEEDEEKHGGADAPPPLWGANGQQQPPQQQQANASHKRSAPEPESHADNDDDSHTDDEPEAEPPQQDAQKPGHASKKRRGAKH